MPSVKIIFIDAGDGVFWLWGSIPCLLMHWLLKCQCINRHCIGCVKRQHVLLFKVNSIYFKPNPRCKSKCEDIFYNLLKQSTMLRVNLPWVTTLHIQSVTWAVSPGFCKQEYKLSQSMYGSMYQQRHHREAGTGPWNSQVTQHTSVHTHGAVCKVPIRIYSNYNTNDSFVRNFVHDTTAVILWHVQNSI